MKRAKKMVRTRELQEQKQVVDTTLRMIRSRKWRQFLNFPTEEGETGTMQTHSVPVSQ